MHIFSVVALKKKLLHNIKIEILKLACDLPYLRFALKILLFSLALLATFLSYSVEKN
jgi:hypothetical protein